jgi:hypothetical protein
MKEADRFINNLAANPIDENQAQSATFNEASLVKDFSNASLSESAGDATEKQPASKSIIDTGSFSTRYNNTART